MKHLENAIKSSSNYRIREINFDTVSEWVCGKTHKHLAKDPMSKEFLEHVSENHRNTMFGILWLQLNHINKPIEAEFRLGSA